jgi:hypothetical protein
MLHSCKFGSKGISHRAAGHSPAVGEEVAPPCVLKGRKAGLGDRLYLRRLPRLPERVAGSYGGASSLHHWGRGGGLWPIRFYHREAAACPPQAVRRLLPGNFSSRSIEEGSSLTSAVGGVRWACWSRRAGRAKETPLRRNGGFWVYPNRTPH